MDRQWSVSVGISSLLTPFVGGAFARISVHDRIEIFGAAEWAAYPGYGTFDMEEGGVRAQVYRSRRVAVAVDLFGGHKYRSPDSARLDDKTAAGLVGGGVGASACFDGARCAWLGDAHVLWARETGAHTLYTNYLGNARLGAVTLGLTKGARLRYVGGFTAFVRRYLSGVLTPEDVALYGGVRWARRRWSLDLGLFAVTRSPYAVPVLGLVYRPR